MGLQQPQHLHVVLRSVQPRRPASAFLPLAVLAAVLGWVLTLSAAAVADTTVPYRVLRDAGAGFLGPGREEPEPEGLRSIKLGVIGPSGRAGGESLRRGVSLAVAEANAEGGHNGLPYEAVFRPDDGPWGMGAKQVTALAYEDSVWAVIGSLDGGDAHLAELVAAKLWVPVITPAASDHTIDYANVPWVFRVFPSDVNQVRLLVRFASAQGHARMVALVEDNREGLTGLGLLRRFCSDLELPFVGHTYETHAPGRDIHSLGLRPDDTVVVWSRPEPGLKMAEGLRGQGYEGTILLPACALSRKLLDRADSLQDLVVVAPYHLGRQDTVYSAFSERYAAVNRTLPDPVAVFSYDTARLTIAAIRKAGLNRARIRDALAETKYSGVAGIHAFDQLGGSELAPVLLVRRDGAWLPEADN